MRSLVANRPLLGAAICLGFGIHMGVMAHSSPWVWVTLSVTIALGWLGFPRWREKGSFVVACLLIAVLGALLSSIPRTQMRHLQESLAPMDGRAVNVRGVVSGTGRWSRWGWQIPIRVESVNNHKITAFDSDWRLTVTESPPVPGTLIQMKGRWNRVPLERIPNRQERGGLCGRLTAEQWHAVGRVVTFKGLLFDGKRRLERIGEQTLSRESAEVLHGMAYNEPIRDTDRIESFQRTGLIHILSVGGLHIGFLAVLLVGLGSLLRIPKKGIYCGVLLILPLFILMVGAEPPAVRAGIMSGLVILGFLLERPVDGVNLWGAAALSVLLFNPLDLYDLGFQLSFGAAGSILWLFPIWRRPVPTRWRPFTDPVILSLTAQVGVLPLLALYFGAFPWVGLLANIVIVPLSTIAVQLGLAAETLGMLWNPLAMILNTSNELVLHWMIGLICWFSDWGTPFALPLFNAWGVLLYYLGIFAIAKLREVNPITHQCRIPQWMQLVILAIIVSLGAGWVLAQAPPDHLRVEVIDVGQGDSILLTAPGGKRLLIDGGPGESFKSSLRPFLRRRMITKLDKVVLTHAHEDHVGGLAKLLEERQISIGEAYDPGIPHTSHVYERFLTGLIEQKIPYRKARRGMHIKLGRDVDAEVLWPPMGQVDNDDLNHNSVVLRVHYGRSYLLFMGDADKEAEQELLTLEGGRLHAQILKVGHHGSRYSSSREFLETVRPNIAAISVGKGNSFGHPSRAALRRLGKTGAVIYRTDRGGSIIIDFINNSQVKIRRETR